MLYKVVIELIFDDFESAFTSLEDAREFFNDEKQSWLFGKALTFMGWIEVDEKPENLRE